MFKNILLIGAGGFIGSVARFFLSKLNLTVELFSIPVGTLLVNVTGCLVIGLLTGVADKTALLNSEWRMFLMVGLCGGFTTFSTFAGENLMLLHNGQFGPLLVYTALSVILGFAAVFFGYAITNIL
ncbi:MAG: fluoride efflux transporter CrcB [Bacteroidales bacterium]|nr:fluoride efflux transporter CrcB [Bacteroidales bacterium]